MELVSAETLNSDLIPHYEKCECVTGLPYPKVKMMVLKRTFNKDESVKYGLSLGPLARYSMSSGGKGVLSN
jgi:hypothetical protein